MTLLAAIDDATGKLLGAVFRPRKTLKAISCCCARSPNGTGDRWPSTATVTPSSKDRRRNSPSKSNCRAAPTPRSSAVS